ncbi:hypothetical protein, partial [Rodentibacter trehalosifermentans]|uniref:hypothetical protein n=1 Tax=Rodentibacter trehalosifermentans TaxID=1908263 RepID=UPI0013F62AA5
FNRQLHQNEKERIKMLAEGDKEKERRLEIAACALVHCSAQIPSDSPDYAEAYEKARALEQLGNTAEYAQERALLKSQTETLSDSWGAGIKKQLFVYNESYKVLDQATRIDSQYGLTTRAGGVVQAVGGGSTVAFGVGLCETGIGCAVGVPVAAYGADHAYTGATAIVSGKPQYTMGGQLLSQLTGLNPDVANLAYDLPNLAAGAKPLLGGAAKLGNQVVSEGAKIASETGYVARELSKDIKSGISVVNNAVTKSYINGQLTYESAIGKGVNGVREYIRNSVKTMGEQKREVVLSNALAAGSVTSGFESYEYIVEKKPMTSENLLKSTTNISSSFSMGGVTSGMKFIPAIALGVAVDRVNTGNYDVEKSTGSAVIGAGVDSIYGDKKVSPLIRESVTKSFEKVYDYYKGEKYEQK